MIAAAPIIPWDGVIGISARLTHPSLPRAFHVITAWSDLNEQPAGPRRPPHAAVPGRPALAAHVDLIGEMQGTGYTDRQWLIRRDGRFIQVTELLYRVAERADGQHTLEEIAEGVTEATDWAVSPDDVRPTQGAQPAPSDAQAEEKRNRAAVKLDCSVPRRPHAASSGGFILNS